MAANFESLDAILQKLLATTRGAVDLKRSGVLSTSTLIRSGPAKVWWIIFSDSAALKFELNDSLDDSGTDWFAHQIPVDGYGILIIDPPLPFDKGIYLDVDTATCLIIVGYTNES